MVVVLAQVWAVLLWALPVSAWWAARAVRGGRLWEYALDVPVAIAVDLLSVLVMARFVTLETAILVSRPAWILAGIVSVLRRGPRSRHSRLGWPAPRVLLAVGTAAAAAFWLSTTISRSFAISDRPLHGPLVPSITAQALPFQHVYGGPLHYHVAGDLFAALLRTLSFDVISSNLALSLAHDVLFAVSAVLTGLLMIGLGARHSTTVVAGSLALLLHGALPLRGGIGNPDDGYSFTLFPALSYRPHCLVSLMMQAGMVGVLAVRAIRSNECSDLRVAYTLLVCGGVLTISDEASTALVGLALGVVWLVSPGLLGRSRSRGALLLVAVAVTVAVSSLLFNGSAGPGGPVEKLTWIPDALVSGYSADALPLSSHEGRIALAFDVLPALACLLALAWTSKAGQGAWGIVLACAAMLAATVVLSLHVRLNGDMKGYELHRLFVAPYVWTLLCTLLYLPRMPPESIPRFAAILGVFVPSLFGLRWLREVAPKELAIYRENDANPWAKESPANLDCRSVAAAHLGERAQPTYVDASLHYVFTSCRPIFGPGRVQSWTMKTVPEFESIPQLRALDADAEASGARFDAMCGADPRARRDAVCAYAVDHHPGECRAEGTRFLRCPLSSADRAAILGRR
jgi:hypothetical protein